MELSIRDSSAIVIKAAGRTDFCSILSDRVETETDGQLLQPKLGTDSITAIPFSICEELERIPLQLTVYTTKFKEVLFSQVLQFFSDFMHNGYCYCFSLTTMFFVLSLHVVLLLTPKLRAPALQSVV